MSSATFQFVVRVEAIVERLSPAVRAFPNIWGQPFYKQSTSLVLMIGAVFALVAFGAPAVRAQAVLDRLSGFDSARVQTAAGWAESTGDEPSGREAAKLTFQVNRLARGGSLGEGALWPESTVGDWVIVSGVATKIARWKLPDELADVLEFAELFRVEVEPAAANDSPVIVFTSAVPKAWLQRDSKPSDRATTASGVLLRSSIESTTAVIAAAGMRWFPPSDSAVPAEWTRLGELGFDVSLFDAVRQRDRQPLVSDDAAAFYPLLRLAPALATPVPSDGAAVDTFTPTKLPAAKLLKDSAALVGRYIELTVQTVRVTRVRAGDDHYWQIDALGDLENVVIKIENKNGPPAIFENRYPVSIVASELPQVVVDKIEATQGNLAAVDVALLSTKITVAGIYYRMWSYESEFMDRLGAGNQFGPLVVASRIEDSEPAAGDVIGVSRLGWYIAGLTIVSVFMAIVGGWIAAKNDAKAKRKQRQGLPEKVLSGPSENTST